MKCRVIIPARYESSRFPGKPLAKICGREMILRVCDKVKEAGLPLCVATDDERIYNRVTGEGYEAVMTSSSHKSGTDRIREALLKLDDDTEIVINVQGDEPFISTEEILAVKRIFDTFPEAELATLVRRFKSEAGIEALEDPNLVKVVLTDEDKRGYREALYFSRSVIPYVRGKGKDEWLSSTIFYTHIGIYGYSRKALMEITSLPLSSLEKSESLEQLRWLQNGKRIKVAETSYQAVGIDTPADLEQAERIISGIKNQKHE